MTDLYEPSLTEMGVHIRLRNENGVTVFGDEGLIHRMIANLLDNALKHLAPSSSVVVSLRVEDKFALLLFEDDGSGFEPEVLEHLFARRVKGRTSAGHGLGLAFVDAVARAHGGTVEAMNRETGGARIAVSLPLTTTEIHRQLAGAA